MGAQSGHPSGLTYVQVWRLDQYGRMAGTETDPDSISNNTTTSSHRVPGVVSFDVGSAEREKIDFRSEDAIAGSRYFGANQSPTGTMGMETVDAVLRAMAEDSLVDSSTVSGWYIMGANDLNPVPNDIGICVSRQMQSRDTGTDGTAFWFHQIYQAQLSMKVPTASFQGVNEASIGVTLTAASRFPNGVALGANQSFYNNKTNALELVTDNPISFTTFVADGAATTFTLPYLPSTSVVTVATEPNFMAINNAETAPSSVNTSTGVVTLSAAGDAADFVSIIYETAFTTA